MRADPPYVKIARAIKEEWILKPSALPGSRLPTERQLREIFGVSRSTIGKALDLLVREGLLDSRQGSGVYIRELRESGPITKLAAFICPHLPLPGYSGDSLPVRALSGVDRRAAQLGWQIVTAMSNFSIEHEEALIERFMRMGAEGIILQAVNYPIVRRKSDIASDHIVRRWHKLPIVLAGVGFEEWRRPLVAFDNYKLGFDMTTALIEHGHRHIVFMHTSEERLHNAIHERRRGWMAALNRAGIGVPDAYHGWPLPDQDYVHLLEPEQADDLVRRLMDLKPRPDALIAWEDAIAVQMMDALKRAGVAIPDEVRVAGFDNHVTGRYYDPPFPTSDPDFPRLGELAMEVLDRMVTEQTLTPRTYLIPAPVLWRGPERNAGKTRDEAFASAIGR